MTTALDVHFHGLEKSEAVENKIREKVAKLKRHFDRMTACRVVVEVPHRNPATKPKGFSIKIEVSVPSGKPIIIVHEREGAHANEDLNLAIRDAFEAAARRVDEVGAKLTDRAKTERGRRRPAPQTITDG